MDLTALPEELVAIIQDFTIDESVYYVLTNPRVNCAYACRHGFLIVSQCKNMPRLMHSLGYDRGSIIHHLLTYTYPNWEVYVPTNAELNLLQANLSNSSKYRSYRRYSRGLTNPGLLVNRINVTAVSGYLRERQFNFLMVGHNKCSRQRLKVSLHNEYMPRLIDLYTPPWFKYNWLKYNVNTLGGILCGLILGAVLIIYFEYWVFQH